VAGLRGGKREKGGPTRLRMGDLRDSRANLVDRALEKGKGRRKGQKKQSRRKKGNQSPPGSIITGEERADRERRSWDAPGRSTGGIVGTNTTKPPRVSGMSSITQQFPGPRKGSPRPWRVPLVGETLSRGRTPATADVYGHREAEKRVLRHHHAHHAGHGGR
jgi:hypothetical protein